MTQEELEEIWRDLSPPDGHHPIDGMTRRRVSPGSKIHTFICLVWPQGNRGVLIEGREIAAGQLPKLPSSRGIDTSIRAVPGEGGERLSLLVTLEHSEFNDLFGAFVLCLLGQLSDVANEKAAFNHAINYLTRWKRMMDGRALDELSLERQRGLLGELNILEHLLLPTLTPIDAVRAWLGPSGSHQDFVHQDAAVEVKSTITKRHSLLRIQNEKQLDDTIFRVLFLVHVRLDESAKGISLPEQVAAIRELLGGEPLAINELNLKLIEAGYRDADSAKYSDKHYVITEPMIYRVHGNFPRMTEANLPGGVGDLSYTIVADGLGDFLLPHTEFEGLMRPQNG